MVLSLFTTWRTTTPTPTSSNGCKKLIDTLQKVSTRCLLETKAIWFKRRWWTIKWPRFLTPSTPSHRVLFIITLLWFPGLRRPIGHSFSRNVRQECYECGASFLNNGEANQRPVRVFWGSLTPLLFAYQIAAWVPRMLRLLLLPVVPKFNSVALKKSARTAESVVEEKKFLLAISALNKYFVIDSLFYFESGKLVVCGQWSQFR